MHPVDNSVQLGHAETASIIATNLSLMGAGYQILPEQRSGGSIARKESDPDRRQQYGRARPGEHPIDTGIRLDPARGRGSGTGGLLLSTDYAAHRVIAK
jgi:hypothetical protein